MSTALSSFDQALKDVGLPPLDTLEGRRFRCIVGKKKKSTFGGKFSLIHVDLTHSPSRELINLHFVAPPDFCYVPMIYPRREADGKIKMMICPAARMHSPIEVELTLLD